MFCPNCGLQQADAKNFCLRCGYDLSKKYEKLSEIAAGATPGGYVGPPAEEPEEGEDEFSFEPEGVQEEPQPVPPPAEPAQGQTQAAQDSYTGPQRFLITQTPVKVPLRNLGLRRLVCLPTFIGCLLLGAFSFVSAYEELAKCIDSFVEPSFGWGVLVAMCLIVGLGVVQALIGMGTIYSWQALAVAFVMSAVCAFVSLNYMPGTWKERLIAFGVFVACALVEATSAIGPIERKKRPPKARPSAKQPASKKAAAATKKAPTKKAR